MSQAKPLMIAFWAKKTGNACSHVKGLTEQQIKELRALEPGDRLIVYVNQPQDDKQPKYTLKAMRAEENDGGSAGSSSSGGL